MTKVHSCLAQCSCNFEGLARILDQPNAINACYCQSCRCRTTQEVENRRQYRSKKIQPIPQSQCAVRQPFWGPGADYEAVDCENNVLLSILPLQNRPRGLRSMCVEVAHKVEHPHMLGRASAAFSEAGADAGPAKRERNVLSCSLPLQNDARDRDSVSVQVARPVSL
jgi:hypothetical protein